jgi:hypothetical protein
VNEQYVETIIQAATRDASIARVLREICALDGAVRAGALELVGAHLRAQAAGADVLACVQALREDAVAQQIAQRLGPPG